MRIGSQTYIFQQHFAARGERFCDRLEESLAMLAEAGFEGCELGLDLFGGYEDAVGMALFRSRLELASVYFGGGLHTDALAESTIAEALRLAPRAVDQGARGVSFNCQPRLEPRKSDPELVLQAHHLNCLGEALGELGLKLWVHTHDPEMADDAREFRSLMELTSPRLVGLCLDTHWVHRGGGDPYAMALRYADRIGTLHVRQSIDGVWSAVLGPGDLPHRPIADLLRDRGFDGWVLVELAQEAGTPETPSLASRLAQSAGYARGIFTP